MIKFGKMKSPWIPELGYFCLWMLYSRGVKILYCICLCRTNQVAEFSQGYNYSCFLSEKTDSQTFGKRMCEPGGAGGGVRF